MYVARGLILMRQYLFRFECEMAVELYLCVQKKNEEGDGKKQLSATS